MTFRVTRTRSSKEAHTAVGPWMNVEIVTLEDLLKLVDNEGSIIIDPNGPPQDGIHEIEIYDDYRE